MKGTTKWASLLALAGLLLAPSTGWAAGFLTYAQSASSTGMANVGAANPEEKNPSYYNPAMMPFQKTFSINVGPTLIIPNTTFEPAGGGETINTEEALFPPPNGHVHYKITDDLAVGVGATLPWGLGISWPDDWVGREAVQSQSIRHLNVTPVVSYRIPDLNLSFAGGAQIIAGEIELNRRVILRDDTEIQTDLGGNGTGFGGIAAAYFQPTDNISIGANYRSAVSVNYDGRVHFEGEEGTPFAEQFVDGAVNTGLTLPHFLAVGFGWQLNRLFLELDLNYTTWETYNQVVINFEENLPQESTTIEGDWNNAGAIRFGARYEVLDGLPVRLGLGYDMTPIPDETVSASLPGNNRLVASVGGGYQLDNGLNFDLSYQLVSALQRDIDNGVAPTGEYKTTAHLVGINVGFASDFGMK